MQSLKQIINLLHGKDPYIILNTSPLQPFSMLKKNYRSLALKYHPDRNKQQSAKQLFIQINLAYQFLQKQQNRQYYKIHLKAIEQHKQRQNAMTEDRKRMLNQLKRRQEEYVQRKKDMDEEVRRKKEFFEKKMKEEQERQKLKEEILSEIKPNQYYQELTSIKVQWLKGLSFTKQLLTNAFKQYGTITNIKIQPKNRQAIITFNSIQLVTNIIKQFSQPLIKIEFLVPRQRREYLLKALKKKSINREQIDFSLTSQNLSRLKEIINRGSGMYLDPNVYEREESL